MAVFSRKGQPHDAGTQIPRVVASADPRTLALGYMLGTIVAAAVITEILTRTA